jgi:hypothetical protein
MGLGEWFRLEFEEVEKLIEPPELITPARRPERTPDVGGNVPPDLANSELIGRYVQIFNRCH